MNFLHLLGILFIVRVYGRPETADTEQPETEADDFFTALTAPRVEDPSQVVGTWEDFRFEVGEKLAAIEKRLANNRKSLGQLKDGISFLAPLESPLSRELIASKKKQPETPVYFSAYRRSDYKHLQSTLTYDGYWVNLGGAMSAKTGYFRAPYYGLYYFYFNAHMQFGTAVLQVNGENRAATGHLFEETSSSGLSQMLELQRGDRVSIFIQSSYMYDATNNPYYKGPYYGTQFTGMLLHNLE